jgi:hypothetical protein
MKNTIVAKLKNDPSLSFNKSIERINQGSNDSTYFYVNGKNVTVCSPFCSLSKEHQKSALNWLLEGLEYTLN